MLKVITEFSDYEPWSGACVNYEYLEVLNKLDEFEQLLEEIYPEGIELVQINDILWFHWNWVKDCLGIDENK